MIIVDDYTTGKICAGNTKADILKEVSNKYASTIIDLPARIEMGSAIHINDNGYDAYIFNIDASELFEYMTQRGCLNFVSGV